MTKKPSITLVGIGKWGKIILKEVYQKTNVLYGVYSGSDATKQWLNDNYPNIPSTTDLNLVLQNPKVKIVMIATPIKTHFDLALRSLRAGKHVFIEKPGTNNSKEMTKLVTEAKKRKLNIFIGYIFTYNQAITKLKHLLIKEEATRVDFYWSKWGSFEENIIQNLLVHDLSLIYHLGFKTIKIKKKEIKQDLIDIHLILDKKIPCHIYINRKMEQKKKTLTVVTNKNTYLWENDQLNKLETKTTNFKNIFIAKETPLETEIDYLVKNISKKDSFSENNKLAIDVLKLTEKL